MIEFTVPKVGLRELFLIMDYSLEEHPGDQGIVTKCVVNTGVSQPKGAGTEAERPSQLG